MSALPYSSLPLIQPTAERKKSISLNSYVEIHQGTLLTTGLTRSIGIWPKGIVSHK